MKANLYEWWTELRQIIIQHDSKTKRNGLEEKVCYAYHTLQRTIHDEYSNTRNYKRSKVIC